MATVYPDGRRVSRGFDSLDRLVTLTEHSGSLPITDFEYLGPNRLARVTHGNGTVLDKTIQGYDGNRRHLEHVWKNAAGLVVAGYRNQYNGMGGLGTNRRISERRTHLGDVTDTYQFDSAYRMIGFDRDQAPSSRQLDPADKMTSFVEEGADREPVPAGGGMNQYASFDGQTRVYTSNGCILGEGDLEYRYDYQNRLISIEQNLGNLSFEVSRYLYDADGRRVYKRNGPLATRYLYDGWRVLEERDAQDVVLRQYVDGRGLDNHCQLKSFPVPDVLDPVQLGILTPRSAHSFDIQDSPKPWGENGLAGYFLELTDSGGKPRIYEISGSKPLETESTHGYPMTVTVSEPRLPNSGSQNAIPYRILAPKGSLETHYYHDNSQGFVGAITDEAGNLVEAVDYRWLGGPIHRDPSGSEVFLDEIDPQNLFFQREIETVMPLAGGGVKVTGGLSTHLFDEGSLVGFFLVLVPNQPPLTPVAFSIIGNTIEIGPQGSQVTTWFHIAEDLNPNDFQGGTLAVYGPKGNQSRVGNPYLFQGRRYDPETGNYYFRHRYYSPERGEFLTFDPKGTWHHGQGNGYSAFNEDGWNYLDPMGLSPSLAETIANRQLQQQLGQVLLDQYLQITQSDSPYTPWWLDEALTMANQPPFVSVWVDYETGQLMSQTSTMLSGEMSSTWNDLSGSLVFTDNITVLDYADREAARLGYGSVQEVPGPLASLAGCPLRAFSGLGGLLSSPFHNLRWPRSRIPGTIVVPSQNGRYLALGNLDDTIPQLFTRDVDIILMRNWSPARNTGALFDYLIDGYGITLVTNPTWGTAITNQGMRVFGQELTELQLTGWLGGIP